MQSTSIRQIKAAIWNQAFLGSARVSRSFIEKFSLKNLVLMTPSPTHCTFVERFCRRFAFVYFNHEKFGKFDKRE